MNDGCVSIPAIREGQLSGIQFFERNLNFRCPKPDTHDGQVPRLTRPSSWGI